MMTRRSRTLILTLLAAAAPAPSWAWGDRGHQAVGIIAQARLTPAALAGCAGLLGEGFSLATVSTWADEVRPERPETAPWHYVNIPITADGYDAARDCPAAGCIVEAIPRLIVEVGNEQLPLERRQEALKFLVHFVGDLGQPLHCGDRRDRGGNDVAIHEPLPADATNLHRLWDFGIIEGADLSAEQLAASAELFLMERPYLPREPLNFERAVTVWANQSQELSRGIVYRGVPAEGPFTVTPEYRQLGLRVIQRQVAVSGVRLAAILNQLFGG